MKFRFSILLAATLIGALVAKLTPPALAQSVSAAQAVTLPQLPGSTATNINTVIDCRFQSTVPLQITTQDNAATTDAISFVFARSLDGTTYETTKNTTLALPGAGTTATTTFTNIPTFGAVKMKFLYYTNAAATAAITNASFKYVLTKGLGY